MELPDITMRFVKTFKGVHVYATYEGMPELDIHYELDKDAELSFMLLLMKTAQNHDLQQTKEKSDGKAQA